MEVTQIIKQIIRRLLDTTDIEIHKLDLSSSPNDSSLLKWFLFFISPYKRPLVYFLFYRIFRYAYFAMLPALVGMYVEVLTSQNSEEINFYSKLGIIYLIIYFILLSNSWVFKRELVNTENASRSVAILGLSILNTLPVTWHAETATGKKIDIVTDARKSIFDLFVIFRWQFMPIVGTLFGVFLSIILLKVEFYFHLIFLLFTFLYLFSSWYFNIPVAKLYDGYKETFSKMLSKLYEFSSSIITVKSLSLEKFVEDKAFNLELDCRDSKDLIYNVVFTRWFIVNSIAGLFLCMISIISFSSARNGSMSAVSSGSLVMLFYTLWTTLEAISVEQDRIYELTASVRRLINLCLSAKSLPKKTYESSGFDKWNNIYIKNISFSYSKESDFSVKEISFEIKKGEVVSLVGPSGSGKSTIIKLLLNLYQPLKGEILIDSVNLREIDPKDWLKNIAFVPQDIELFDGSIRDNILLDRDFDNSYNSVLEQSCLSDFINTLPDKDKTLIGERGVKLSGGQRQRIGIARALLRNPELLILDEATSSLDSITENKIQDLLFKNLKGKTMLIIAHRLSTVRAADKIVVLDNGGINDQGSFTELLKREGLFSEMWGIQGLGNT